jgi:ribosomal protein S18 acetylase RimI-like enzyme
VPRVRRAIAADLATAADTLALAQVDYAWATWAFPSADRLDRMRRSFALDLELGAAWDAVWVSDDVSSVAIWSPPVRPPMDAARIAEVQAAQAELIDVDRMRRSALQTQPYHPSEPYWYLGTVGTLPDRRGEGLASAVLQPVLEACDRTSIVACLETSSDDNVRLYRRLGFEVIVRLHTDDDTRLPLIVMERLPTSRTV